MSSVIAMSCCEQATATTCRRVSGLLEKLRHDDVRVLPDWLSSSRGKGNVQAPEEPASLSHGSQTPSPGICMHVKTLDSPTRIRYAEGVSGLTRTRA